MREPRSIIENTLNQIRARILLVDVLMSEIYTGERPAGKGTPKVGGQVFISYAREDSGFADELEAKMAEGGFRPWRDKRDIRGGEHWREAIDKAIRESKALVLIMTPAAKRSEYVTYEWGFALGAKVPVIPIILKKTTVHRRLQDLNLRFFTDHPYSWDTLIEDLKNPPKVP